MITKEFEGSTALVTGATSGIGRATATRLASQGAHVLVGGRDAARGQLVVEAIRADGGRASFVQGDLLNVTATRDFAHCALERVEGRIDILINNAGVFPFVNTAGASEEEIDSVFAVNVKAPYVLVGELAPRMAERGRGSIVNVLTMRANFGMPGMALYGASKSALMMLTMAWASEFGPSGVRVNAVSPGPTLTEGTAMIGEAFDQLAAVAPAGRVASPDEIATAITFLASDLASFSHGSVIDVDGGRSAI